MTQSNLQTLTTSTMNYEKSNANPKRHKAGDCVVRALSHATQEPWLDVYDELCAIGRDTLRMPNDKQTYEAYLQKKGWKKHPMPKFTVRAVVGTVDGGIRKEERTRRYTIARFVDENPDLVAVVSVAGHLTFVSNRTLHDTWNCGYKCIGNYWTKN